MKCERHGFIRCSDCAYIEELKEENQRLADRYNFDVYTLESQIMKLQKALEWYAGSDKFGQRARTVLQSIQGGVNT